MVRVAKESILLLHIDDDDYETYGSHNNKLLNIVRYKVTSFGIVCFYEC